MLHLERGQWVIEADVRRFLDTAVDRKTLMNGAALFANVSIPRHGNAT